MLSNKIKKMMKQNKEREREMGNEQKKKGKLPLESCNLIHIVIAHYGLKN